MASSRTHIYLLVLSAALLLRIRNQSQPNLHTRNNHVALIIFGDSLFDAGNNNYLKDPIGSANFWPYGLTFFNNPTGRVSDGRLITDFIAEYLKLPLIRPYLEPGVHHFTDGVNFASGGAGALIETHKGRVIDLKTQVNYLKNVKRQIRTQIGNKETEKLISKAIYMISIGGNDYASRSTEFESLSEEDYVEIVIDNLTSAIKGIYKSGGRKFVFIGVGSFECAPIMRSQLEGNCNKEIKALINLHNTELLSALTNIQTQLKEFQYVFFDFYVTLSERINNPSTFGFSEGKVACCGGGPYRGNSSCGLGKDFEVCKDVNEHIFFDSIHPTEKLYKQFGELLWSGHPNVTTPYNLQEMVHS